jgi:uncharacterized protein YbjT (DUF2867 family)
VSARVPTDTVHLTTPNEGADMKIAVAGSTGMVGAAVCSAARGRGHEIVEISRHAGVDVTDSDQLTAALNGVDAVVDTLNTTEQDPEVAAAYFADTTRALLAAEQATGIAHHVALSIVNVDQVPGPGHYAGKRAQEQAVAAGDVPWTVVRATQFFDFPAQVVGWTAQDGTAVLAPLLLQPVDVRDVADALLDAAESAPENGFRELAGPETLDMVDMARRTLDARGDRSTKLLASWQNGFLPIDMAGEVLLPGPQATIGRHAFDDWLAEQADQVAQEESK